MFGKGNPKEFYLYKLKVALKAIIGRETDRSFLGIGMPPE
jgi:hypothetical protein